MPIQRAHGEVVVASVVYGGLLFEIFKGMEPMCYIEVFIVFSVRSLHLAVVPRCVGTHELILYSQLF